MTSTMSEKRTKTWIKLEHSANTQPHHQRGRNAFTKDGDHDHPAYLGIRIKQPALMLFSPDVAP